MPTYQVFENVTDYTFTNDDYRLLVQVPRDGSDLTSRLYDLKSNAEPVSLSLNYEHVAGFAAFANDSMAIGYALALVDAERAAVPTN